MISTARAIGVIGLLLSTTAAHAVSITNRDERDHRVTIIEGETRADYMMKPSQTLTDICLKGCTIRLNDSDDDAFRLAASDVVTIEDGTVYYDGPDPTDGTKAPQPTGKRPGSKG